MTGCHNGLLKDLIVLGYIPIAKAVIGDLGFVHQDRRHQLPNGLASTNQEDKSIGYLVSGWVWHSRLERHPAARWPRNILPSGSHVVAAGQPDPSLTKAVHPSVRPLGRRRRRRQQSTTRSLLVGAAHRRHIVEGLLEVGWVC